MILNKLNLTDSWLGFWGSYTGAIITLLGIYWTLSKDKERDNKAYLDKIFPDIFINIYILNYNKDNEPFQLKIEFNAIGSGNATDIVLYRYYDNEVLARLNLLLAGTNNSIYSTINDQDISILGESLHLYYSDINSVRFCKIIDVAPYDNFIDSMHNPLSLHHSLAFEDNDILESKVVVCRKGILYSDDLIPEIIDRVNTYYYERNINAVAKAITIRGKCIEISLSHDMPEYLFLSPFNLFYPNEEWEIEVAEGNASIY